jgi:tRNA threonylcarbamoyladenosine biosynthesis protein TsaE
VPDALVTTSASETQAAGESIGRVIKVGDIVCLTGELGAGKTVFVRGLCAGAGGNADSVRSPTFVLEHVYDGGPVPLHHVDCYRLGPGANLDVIDLDTSLATGAAVIEWGEYADLEAYQPAFVRFEIGEGDHRRIYLDADPRGRFAPTWKQQ